MPEQNGGDQRLPEAAEAAAQRREDRMDDRSTGRDDRMDDRSSKRDDSMDAASVARLRGTADVAAEKVTDAAEVAAERIEVAAAEADRRAVDAAVQREQLAARKFDEAADKLIRISDTVAGQLEQLATEVAKRPTTNEVTYLRRRLALVMGLALLFAIQVQDTHVEQCGPGARAERITSYVSGGSNIDINEIRQLSRMPMPAVCDVTFPLHTHQPEDSWPTLGNVAGVAGYSLIILAGVLWMRQALVRRQHEKESE